MCNLTFVRDSHTYFAPVFLVATLFTLKKPEGQEEIEEDDDEFQTDDEEEDMEVSEPEEAKQAVQKRKKVFRSTIFFSTVVFIFCEKNCLYMAAGYIYFYFFHKYIHKKSLITINCI